jgi:enoyl-CoA hydratase/carnithine racemase
MRFTPHLLPSRSSNLGVLLLNNPKALNAVSLEMIHCMQDLLNEWVKQEDCPSGVLIKSSTEENKAPAFCAGGDIKRLYQIGLTEEAVGQGKPGLHSSEFFRQEYLLNNFLATLTTSSMAPYHNNPFPRCSQNPVVISFWDGIVMGGGVGISIYGKYRIATERTVFAMPETGIGLFPDVGTTFWMPRLLSPSLALYIALTGRRLMPADLIYTGLATHYVSSENLEQLEQELISASTKDYADPFGSVLDAFDETTNPPPDECSLAQDSKDIDNFFGNAKSVEDIMATLSGSDPDSFAGKTHSILSKMSPTSLKITMLGLERGAAATNISDALRMEYRMAQGCLRARESRRSDFYEGVRAALVDKDRNPCWNPASLQDVTEDHVESFFEPIEHELEFSGVEDQHKVLAARRIVNPYPY